MMRELGLAAAACWALAGCGDSDSPSAAVPAGDASTSGGSSNDGSSGAAGSAGMGGTAGMGGSAGIGGSAGAGPDAGRWDGRVQPKTLLQAGDGIQLHGVTADGYVIYYAPSDSSLRAVPVWGGPSEVIYPGSTRVSIRGRTVFAAPSASAGVPFTVWWHGAKPLRIPNGPVSNSVYSVDDAAATDPDHQRIVFTRDVGGGVLHMIGANIDLSNEVDLTIGGTGRCSQVYYAAAHFVTTGCPASGSYTLDSWDASWKRTAHYSGPGLNLTYDGVQVAGDRIVYGDNQSLRWATPGNAQATTLLPNGVYGFVASPDGKWVVYYGYTETRVSSIDTWAPVDVVGLGLSSLSGKNAATFSPNNAFFAATGNATVGAGFASVTSGTSVKLTGSNFRLLDRAFSSDSRYVLHSTDQGIFAAPVDGKPSITITPLRSFTNGQLVAGRGAKVAYVNQETEQLMLRDLDSTAAPVVLSEGVPSAGSLARTIATTAERDTIVYVVSTGDGQHGLFAVGVP